jgi:hypothetical protein
MHGNAHAAAQVQAQLQSHRPAHVRCADASKSMTEVQRPAHAHAMAQAQGKAHRPAHARPRGRVDDGEDDGDGAATGHAQPPDASTATMAHERQTRSGITANKP